LLYILFGQDSFSLRESLEEIKRDLGDPELLATNTTILDGQQLTLEQLRTATETIPFLAEKRLVIIQGLLERFEPKGRSARQRRAKKASGEQNSPKSFSTHISQIPDSTVLVLIGNKVRTNNPLLRALSGNAQVKTFPLLKNTKLHYWIQKRVTQEGGSISSSAVDLLAELVGNNLWIMASEINKLVLFTSGRRIEAEDVRAVVSYAQETNVFAMVDAILELKAGVAEQRLQQLLVSGAAPAYLMVMLSRQVRMIVRAKELRNQGKSEAEIQDKLNLTSAFALGKVLSQADRYSTTRLKEVYYRLLETDLSIKTGKYQGELALNLLIAELCQGQKSALGI